MSRRCEHALTWLKLLPHNITLFSGALATGLAVDLHWPLVFIKAHYTTSASDRRRVCSPAVRKTLKVQGPTQTQLVITVVHLFFAILS